MYTVGFFGIVIHLITLVFASGIIPNIRISKHPFQVVEGIIVILYPVSYILLYLIILKYWYTDSLSLAHESALNHEFEGYIIGDNCKYPPSFRYISR
jgi:hypothetical protein